MSISPTSYEHVRYIETPKYNDVPAEKINSAKNSETHQSQTNNYDTVNLYSTPDIRKFSSGVQSSPTELNGTTYIDNLEDAKKACFKTENKYNQSMTEYKMTSATARIAASEGAAVHAFLYQDLDFLNDAAQRYSKLDEGQDFKYRAIGDFSYLQDTMDFFTDGNYTKDDMQTAQNQMSNVVKELAERMKNGESTDLHSLKETITIGGQNMTIGQLMDFQSVGKALQSELGKSDSDFAYQAKKGIVKSMSNFYGNSNGESGKLFSNAMDTLYQKSIDNDKSTTNWALSEANPKYASYDLERANTSFKIGELFANVDTSSLQNMQKDFADKIKSYSDIMQKFGSKNGGEVAGFGDYINNTTSFFSEWVGKLS